MPIPTFPEKWLSPLALKDVIVNVPEPDTLPPMVAAPETVRYPDVAKPVVL